MFRSMYQNLKGQAGFGDAAQSDGDASPLGRPTSSLAI
jgi:hypothetical protein